MEGRRKPVQYVLREVDLPWHEEDWRGLYEEEQSQKLDQYLKQDRSLPFDFSKPPLMRVDLIRKTQDPYFMLWSQHHIVSGWLVFAYCFERFLKDNYAQLSLGESRRI